MIIPPYHSEYSKNVKQFFFLGLTRIGAKRKSSNLQALFYDRQKFVGRNAYIRHNRGTVTTLWKKEIIRSKIWQTPKFGEYIQKMIISF